MELFAREVMPHRHLLADGWCSVPRVGEIYGYTFAAVSLGAGVGPLLMGVGFDATGSYGLVLGTFVVATLTAAGLMTRLGPYRVWGTAAEPAVAAGG